MNFSTTTWNIEDFQQNADYFSGLYEKSQFKLIAIALSVIWSLILLPFLFGMIWKEHNGADIKRIIINRLICSLAWSCIAFITVFQSSEILRHLNGPFPESFCFFYLLMKNALSQQVALLLIMLFVFRYIFIFCLKNPMAFQDEFWSFFINLWLSIFCLVSQWLILYLPGQQPISFYFCSGQNPSENSLPFHPKQNTILRLFNIGAMMLLFAMYIRIEIFKLKDSNITTWFEKQKKLYLQALEDNFLTSYLVYLLIILNTAVGTVLIIKINSLNPVESNFYPNYIYINFYQLFSPLQVVAAGLFAYYKEHRKLIPFLFSEIKDNIGLQKYIETK